ncbi:putative secreted protein (Por secretion system target) [Flavobacterium sp. 270]|uniref:T9SS type A sorting domain-containing protein n=1 Tax=Flavobacterium sp. 270 TaxID=2512114 RepID=UPI0010DA92D5|nr:T9SS type A sorting domain-containing protein [Flavobacterium sp. 270]TDW44609.1 putative secreted protein (Por secretion system target) [Flavobacterium sp. 270]
MKKTLLLFLILSATKSVSQIYFSPNASMYVKNQVLFVKQDVNLAANSNLYLRNNSQLLQGSTTTSTNVGLGTLSVYQEGSSDNYDYNYWCSPVGIASAAAGNQNFGITMLSRPTTSTASTTAVILPTTDRDGISMPLSIASRWVYKLVNANNYSQWLLVGGTTALGPGEGFTMKGTSGTDAIDPAGMGTTNNPGGAQRYDFRGKPNDGNIVVTLGLNNATLTGNPYPSALHLNAFLLDATNAAITGGIAYFWQQDKATNSHLLSAYRGGYGSYAPINSTSEGLYLPPTFKSYNQDGTVNSGVGTTGSVIARRYSPIGQGFLLNGKSNGTVTFKNIHRVFIKEGVTSQFEKHAAKTTEKSEEAEPLSYFKLNTIINNEFTRQLALAFVPEATDGVDIGIDALNMTTDLPSDVNFWIEDSNYVIQGINFDETKKVPLKVKATESTTFKFSIAESINFDASQAVYIYDALDGSYHDIKNGSYLVTVAPGTYTDRFKITFTAQTLGVSDNETAKQFFVFQDNANSTLKASNPNSLSIKSFTLYDITGKVILFKKNLATDLNYTFSTSGLSHGIYIAEFLTADNEKLTQKVYISNSGK